MKKLVLITFIFSGFLLSSCSQESNGRLSKAYHNTTARFNAYFLAKEKMIEIENSVLAKTENDYNKILDLYPTYDSNFAKSLRPMFDECIKKSSLPIQWHKNSKWVDNSYILIGKCRLYGLDYNNAAATFKFVNAKGTDKHDKHTALILLMRTYLETKDYSNAVLVRDFLKNDTLNSDNTREFALTQALYHQIHGEYDREAEQLEIALPNIKVRDQKSRVAFILAQIYQLHQNDKESYKRYQQVLKLNPPYELSFFTKLYMAQVTSLSSNSDTKKIYKYFKNLIKDEKNLEYQDKMYYEMAKFELKQNNVDEGIKLLKKSIEVGEKPIQKAYSYLKIGEVYYEKVKNYKVAANYYDSCLVHLPKNNLQYRDVEIRAKVLDEFVEQLSIIQLQDSLLNLAKMNKQDLDAFLDKAIADDVKNQIANHEAELARAKKKEEQKESTASVPGANPALGFGDANAKWYFYNPVTMSSGKIEFAKKWGNRPLEDNWRRSDKDAPANEEIQTENNIERNSKKNIANAEFKPKPLDKNNLLKTIPFEKEDKDSAIYKSAEAQFKLGRIYKLKLKEPENAIESYKTHLTKFPDNKRHVEVMYALYLMYREYEEPEKEKAIKERILNEFPHSFYAKLIKNPNYLAENKQEIIKLKENYRTIYKQYEAKNFGVADTLISEALLQYPDNEIEDKYVLLRAIIKGRQRKFPEYKQELTAFINTYKSSSSIKYAQKLLEGINNYKEPDTTSIKSDTSKSTTPETGNIITPETPVISENPETPPANDTPNIEQRDIPVLPKEQIIPTDKK